MIQDIAPHNLDNHYYPDRKIEKNDRVIVLSGKEVLVRRKEELDFPTFKDLNLQSEPVYLFSVDEERFFGVITDEKPEASETTEYKEINALRESMAGPQYRVFALYTAIHLISWYKETRFCGKCGKPLIHSSEERCMVCGCGYRSYPRLMPAVIVGVRNGNKLLLTRYRRGYKHNALIAGFTEIGETLEETVAREVMEEAGIKVKNISYYKSQPWGTAKDILMGFFCEVDGDDTIRMDEGELKYAAWVERADIELQPDNFSLTNEMMMVFKNGIR